MACIKSSLTAFAKMFVKIKNQKELGL